MFEFLDLLFTLNISYFIYVTDIFLDNSKLLLKLLAESNKRLNATLAGYPQETIKQKRSEILETYHDNVMQLGDIVPNYSVPDSFGNNSSIKYYIDIAYSFLKQSVQCE